MLNARAGAVLRMLMHLLVRDVVPARPRRDGLARDQGHREHEATVELCSQVLGEQRACVP